MTAAKSADANTNPEHELCERWAHWVTTRKFYAPPPLGAGILAKLSTKKTRATQPGGPDAELSADLWALNMAITAQPLDERRRAFELHYRYRVRNIKAAAEALGISRASWYRYVNEFAKRVSAARHAVIEAQRQAAAAENCLTD